MKVMFWLINNSRENIFNLIFNMPNILQVLKELIDKFCHFIYKKKKKKITKII